MLINKLILNVFPLKCSILISKNHCRTRRGRSGCRGGWRVRSRPMLGGICVICRRSRRKPDESEIKREETEDTLRVWFLELRVN